MAAVLARGITKGLRGGEDSEYLDDSRRGCLSSPFALYYIVAIATNSAAILAAIVSQWDFHYNGGYGYDRLDAWYFCNGLFGAVHIVAALYIVGKIEAPVVGHETNGYVYQADDEAPPPVSPQYAQHVVPMDRHQKDGILKTNPTLQSTKPGSWARVKYVMLEDKVVALYIVVFFIYAVWHFFFDWHTRSRGMRLVMRCADIFIMAGPISFFFCAGKEMTEGRN